MLTCQLFILKNIFLENSMKRLSKRVKMIDGSPTLELLKIKSAMIEKGDTILDFGAGEPDFSTPDYIKKAGIEAINSNFTKYTSASGISELKKAISYSYLQEQGVEPKQSEIVVTSGSKYGIFLIMQALVNTDDEVIIPKPYWVTYPQLVSFSGGKIIYADHINQKDIFELTAESYIKKYSKKTKVIIINTPSNPTGELMKISELKEIIKFFSERGVFIIFDDCYRRIIYTDDKFVSPLAISPEAKENIAIVGSLSKTYAMTGWRIGYTIAPEFLCSAISKILGHSTSSPCSISQKAAVTALNEEDSSVEQMISEYRNRRDLLTEKIKKIDNLKFRIPSGAFYFFVDFSYYIQKMGFKNDTEFAMDILDSQKIIMVPGSAFGAPGYMRISYAASLSTLNEGVDRIKKYLTH